MAEEIAPASNDRVNLVYESRTGDQTETVELPFKLLVLGDFTLDERSEYFEEQVPVLLNAEGNDIDILFRQFKPSLTMQVEDRLQQRDENLVVELKFSRLDDFSPASIVRQVSWLNELRQFADSLVQSADNPGVELQQPQREIIDNILQQEGVSVDELKDESQHFGWLIASFEKRLCEQLDRIIHHPEMMKMERAWRSIHFLIERTDFNENCEIAVLNISKQGLEDEFEDVPEITRSRYYQIVYGEEYGQFGGRPYGAIVADFDFGPKAPDVRCLQNLASVSAVAHAPLLAAASAEMFDIDSFSRFSRLRDLSAIYSQPGFVKWNAFRESPDARYVGLTIPYFLLRESYQEDLGGGLQYAEKVSSKDHELLWGNAAFALASRLMDSFSRYRWCLNCTGQSSGLVRDMNMREGRISTQFILTDRRESDVVNQGFIPLSVHKGDDTAGFYSAYSTHRIVSEDERKEVDLSLRLSAQLPYLLIVSRISQYLKVMQREHVGSWRNRRDLDQQLNKWLSGYVSDMDNPAPGVRARRPLRRAEVKVREVEGKQDWFVTRIEITPHLKFMGNSFHLSETSKMEKN